MTPLGQSEPIVRPCRKAGIAAAAAAAAVVAAAVAVVVVDARLRLRLRLCVSGFRLYAMTLTVCCALNPKPTPKP